VASLQIRRKRLVKHLGAIRKKSIPPSGVGESNCEARLSVGKNSRDNGKGAAPGNAEREKRHHHRLNVKREAGTQTQCHSGRTREIVRWEIEKGRLLIHEQGKL